MNKRITWSGLTLAAVALLAACQKPGDRDDTTRGYQLPAGETHLSVTFPEVGPSGNDLIRTGDGDDVLRGGAGQDRLDGGAGADTYLVDANDDGWDVIDDRAGSRIAGSIETGAYLASDAPPDDGNQGPLDAALQAQLRALLGGQLTENQEWALRYGSSLSFDLPATAGNLNALMRLDQRPLIPAHVRAAWSDSMEFNPHSAIHSLGLDALIARVSGRPALAYSILTWTDARPRPQLRFDDETLRALSADTLCLGPGVDPADLQARWATVDTADGSERALSLSWGGPGGVHVLMPEDAAPGVGIERIAFADGTAWSMDAFIASQTDLLIQAMASVPPSSAASFTPSFGATTADPFMPVIAVSAL